jgi:hypothetical protein
LSGDWRGIETEDRREPITHNNPLIGERNWWAGREIGGGREEREEGPGIRKREGREREGNRPGGPEESDWERRERGGSSSQASVDFSL